MRFPPDSIERLERWLDRLESTYVVLALQVVDYERTHEAGSTHDDYVQMDRLEADMARAHRALEFARKRSS